MDKHQIFLEIEHLEEKMGQMYSELGTMKKTLIDLLEENKRLSIENGQLRNLLKKEAQPTDDEMMSRDDISPPGQGIDNLAKLYQEGFHICNVNYGHLRTEGDCLFCLSFLNK